MFVTVIALRLLSVNVPPYKFKDETAHLICRQARDHHDKAYFNGNTFDTQLNLLCPFGNQFTARLSSKEKNAEL
ncbi:hypothetical protein G9C98_003526 [Cotesia typhae]|uniref:Uncharacterized protein n=1 Tax=Cotesia typhae TaxID=2053667 RepID=A0A8J5RGC3_9HYME|nr:hypothetical protein G9C98_003526 [Cotesia typhae]